MGISRAISVRLGASTVGLSLLCALSLFALSGCNNGKQLHADLYQRELRLQEDEIYHLEDYIEEYQAIVRGYRIEVADLKKQLATAEQSTVVSRDAPVLVDEPDDVEMLAPEELIDTPIEIDEAPEFERPYPAPEADEAPPFIPSSASEPLKIEPIQTKRAQPPGHKPAPFSAPNSAAKLVRLAPREKDLLDVRNGPIDPSGAATLLATVQASRELAGYQGEISLLLTDPAGAERIGIQENKLARWDFTPEEVADCWTEEGEIELPLLLPIAGENKPPTYQSLRMWVRLVDESGRKTLDHIEVEFLDNPFRLAVVESVAQAETDAQPTEGLESEEPTEWRRAVMGRIASPRHDYLVAPASAID